MLRQMNTTGCDGFVCFLNYFVYLGYDWYLFTKKEHKFLGTYFMISPFL